MNIPCQEHKDKGIGCLCLEDHCAGCTHKLKGMDAEFMKFIEQVDKLDKV